MLATGGRGTLSGATAVAPRRPAAIGGTLTGRAIAGV